MHTSLNMHIIMHTESHNYVVCSVVQARRMHSQQGSTEYGQLSQQGITEYY